MITNATPEVSARALALIRRWCHVVPVTQDNPKGNKKPRAA